MPPMTLQKSLKGKNILLLFEFGSDFDIFFKGISTVTGICNFGKLIQQCKGKFWYWNGSQYLKCDIWNMSSDLQEILLNFENDIINVELENIGVQTYDQEEEKSIFFDDRCRYCRKEPFYYCFKFPGHRYIEGYTCKKCINEAWKDYQKRGNYFINYQNPEKYPKSAKNMEEFMILLLNQRKITIENRIVHMKQKSEAALESLIRSYNIKIGIHHTFNYEISLAKKLEYPDQNVICIICPEILRTDDFLDICVTSKINEASKTQMIEIDIICKNQLEKLMMDALKREFDEYFDKLK